MNLTLTVSVRSYNELDDNIRLIQSINNAYNSVPKSKGFLLALNWFDNSIPSIQDALTTYARENLVPSIQTKFILGNNQNFSYWKSVEKAILSARTKYVLILSGHCILQPNLFVEIIPKLESCLVDCIIVPTAVNPYHFPSFYEYQYITLFNNKLFLYFIGKFSNRFLAAYPFSNSNAIYRVEALRVYPIPHVDGNEDTIWMKKHACHYSVLSTSAIQHSHRPQRRLSLRRQQIMNRLQKAPTHQILINLILKTIISLFLFPPFLIYAYLHNLIFINSD